MGIYEDFKLNLRSYHRFSGLNRFMTFMKNRHLWTWLVAMFLSVPVMAQSSVGELEKEDFLQAVDSVVQAVVEEEADVVVVGFDTELVYEKLNKACHFLRRGFPPRIARARCAVFQSWVGYRTLSAIPV